MKLNVYERPEIITQALCVMESMIRDSESDFGEPQQVKDYMRLLIGDKPHEVFVVMFLNAQHKLIETVEMFRGTVNQTSVYPREIVIEALSRNACSVIFAHNHPSGAVNPSNADERLTKILKNALSLVDVRVLDHIIVSRSSALSMAEKGLI